MTEEVASFYAKREPWMQLAECKGMDIKLFFPDRGQPSAQGKAVCARCPVRTECDDYATRTETEYGTWGGRPRSRGRHTKTEYEPEENEVIPVSLSATSIESYLECPARFNAEKILFAGMPSNSAADLGTVCHAAAEMWVKGGHYQAGYDRNTEIDVMNAIYEEQYRKVFHDTKRFNEGKKLIHDWLVRQDWTGRTVVTIESKEHFMIPTSAGEIKVNFIIDRLDLVDDVPEVVDYKTISRPLSPEQLKDKVQARIYALAAQLKYPDAEKVWVIFDLLRYDRVGVVFTREENRETWRWLLKLAEQIIADDGTQERLNDSCLYCVRKHECQTLQRHASAGGFLGITDVEKAVAAHYQITKAIPALNAQKNELERVILEHMKKENVIEDKIGGVTTKVAISGRRNIDPQLLRPIIGDQLMAENGGITIKAIDDLLAGDRLTDEQKQQVKQLIYMSYSEPSVQTKVKP